MGSTLTVRTSARCGCDVGSYSGVLISWLRFCPRSIRTPGLRFFGVANSLLISSDWFTGSMGSDSATAEGPERSRSLSGVQPRYWRLSLSSKLFESRLKHVDLRRAPLLLVPSVAIGNHPALFSSLTNFTAPTDVATYFVSKRTGVQMAPPSNNH